MRSFIGMGCCASIMPVGGTIAWASLSWGVTASAAVAALSWAAKESNRAKAPLIATSGTFIKRSMLCFSNQAGRQSSTRSTDKSYEFIDFVRNGRKKMKLNSRRLLSVFLWLRHSQLKFLQANFHSVCSR
jgi:hypothetical protein